MARTKQSEDSMDPATAQQATQPDETAMLKAQLDEVLDLLTEQQQEIAVLRAAQTGQSAAVVQQNDEQARMDAELEALKAEFADDPAIQIFERRVLHGKDAGADVRLKDEPPYSEDPRGDRRVWKLRWFNLGKEGRGQQATDESYVKVRWDELLDRESVISDDKSDGYVRKGERGTEVLYKMRLKLYEYKKRRDAMARQGLLTSESRMKDHLANSVASAEGVMGGNADRAGTFAHGINLTITPGPRETVASA